ncbi:conserved hypothetical protein [Mesorhizobium sp. SOD10]|nr:conserved hypothetical protein [Mesorhizobium sp. SOD10]
MSGVLSFLTKSTDPEPGIIMLTDGACYDHDGVLVGIRRKVTVSKRMPLAVAFRGNQPFGMYTSQLIINAAEELGFDGMLADLAAALPAFARSPNYEILIAGISESLGPTQRMFMNKPAVNDTRPAFELIDPGHIHWGLGSDTGKHFTFDDIGIPFPRQEETIEAWLSRHGRSIFEYHRRMRIPIDPTDPNTDRQHLIGGILDMTVVTAGSVSVRMLHRWPDIIGEKIDPFHHDLREAA